MAMAVSNGATQTCAAARMWRNACDMVKIYRPCRDDAWNQIVAAVATDGIWHSLRNCVAYQAEVWENLVRNGIQDVLQPGGFQMALVLRHTPLDVSETILCEILNAHPHSQELSSYTMGLLTGEEIPAGGTVAVAPARDLQLFADCELAVLAAPHHIYDEHVNLVRMEYSQLSQSAYSEMRLKILNQFSMLPVLFVTPEFDEMEGIARENINREIKALKEQQ